MDPRAPTRDQDPEFVRRTFAAIAPRYALTNHVLSLGIDVLWRRRVAAVLEAELKAMGRDRPLVLDAACGSGDLAVAVLRRCPGIGLIATDFCRPMLERARGRGVANLIVADGMRLPLAGASVDAVTIGFGLRNMESWSGAVGEMARVLRPGGVLLVLDFSLPPSRLLRAAYRLYLHGVLPAVAQVITGEGEAYRHLCGSIERFPSGEAMCALLRANGFEHPSAEPLSFGIATIYVARKG